MMPVRRSLLLVLVLLVLATLAGKPVPVLVDDYGGRRAEALHNPFLALGLHARAGGAQVTFSARLAGMPPEGAVLWLPASGNLLGPQQSAALLDWVARGGRLVLAPMTPGLWTDAPDPLLAALGATLVVPGADRLDEVLGKWPGRAGLDERGVPYATGDGHVLRMALGERTAVVETPLPSLRPALCDPAGCRFLRRPLGRGELMLFSAPQVFTNDRIARLDHAAVFARHVPLPPGSHFVILYEEAVPDLLALAWRHASWALLAGALALALSLWHALVRFGPPLAPPPPDRRRLGEHVEAAGWLLARRAGPDAIWERARAHFLQTLARRHPGAGGTDDAATLALLERRSGLPADTLDALLNAPAGNDRHALAARIGRLEKLRMTL